MSVTAVLGDVTAEEPARGSEFAALSRRVKDASLLRRRPRYYAVKIALTGLAYVGGWLAFVLVGASWWQLATAAYLGFAFTQTAFLGHDAGHKQISRTRRGSYLLGLLHGNMGVGLSYGWWIDKHNRHHAHPNAVDRDPDVEPGVLVFAEGRLASRRRLARAWTRMQAFVFFPLLLLEGLNLHVASLRALRAGTVRSRGIEGALLFAHLAGYSVIVLAVLPPLQALAFVAVQQGVFGLYMGASFAPNHKGMYVVRPGEQLDYLRRQVLTSRNVSGGRFVDFVFGGLNYQIEHHLFPSMPRPSLRRAQPIVKAFCHERGVPYCETSLWSSYRQALHHMHRVGQVPAPGFDRSTD